MHVVIIGSSIAGLSAAAALHPLCNKITLIEKDQPPSADQARRYAPQGSHIHVLLLAGLNMLDGFLPGFREDLIHHHAACIPLGLGQQVFEYGCWRPNRNLEMDFLGQSRLLLESLLYRRVTSLPNVEIVPQQVENINFQADRVTGVTLKNGEFYAADGVVDASGAGGKLSAQLLSHLNLHLPVEINPIHIFYSTVHFKKPPEYHSIYENILIVPEAGVSNLGGSLIDIENQTWCVSLHGRDGESIPSSHGEWLSMIENLPDKRIWERIHKATAIGEVTHFKKAEAVWRRFDQCENLPKGYFPVGDTINSLNPIFGQGMSVAIGHAQALFMACKNYLVHGDGDRLTSEFFNDAMKWTEKSWKKSLAFDRNFFSESANNHNRIELVRKLTAAQHHKILDSEEFHLKILKEMQMLE
jgi:2-polyprenyl-6-methoxyphenol hydroxylase-like FAD-dependent oxidoreductase